MPSPLGSLEPVDLRTIWPDEARDFTPWLAQEENLRRLSDALNLELELDRVEVAVGPYSADIVATDASSNSKVVIENQLEKTNHDHLGKVLTYASGLEARILIWIAKKFTEVRLLRFLGQRVRGILYHGIHHQRLPYQNAP